MQQFLRVAAIIATLGGLMLTVPACGNKGALYIPEPPPEARDSNPPAE